MNESGECSSKQCQELLWVKPPDGDLTPGKVLGMILPQSPVSSRVVSRITFSCEILSIPVRVPCGRSLFSIDVGFLVVLPVFGLSLVFPFRSGRLSFFIVSGLLNRGLPQS